MLSVESKTYCTVNRPRSVSHCYGGNRRGKKKKKSSLVLLQFHCSNTLLGNKKCLEATKRKVSLYTSDHNLKKGTFLFFFLFFKPVVLRQSTTALVRKSSTESFLALLLCEMEKQDGTKAEFMPGKRCTDRDFMRWWAV